MCVTTGPSGFGEPCDFTPEENCQDGHLCIMFEGMDEPGCFEACPEQTCSQNFWNCSPVGDGTNNVPLCIAMCNSTTYLCDQVGWQCLDMGGQKICVP